MTTPVVLPLKKVRNPRDLGGYIGYQGRKVKMHRLLRSGKISDLDAHDIQFLQEYGLSKIIDLRSPKERSKCPDSNIAGVEHLDFSLSVDDNTNGGKKDMSKVFELYRHDQYAGFKMMCERYKSHVMKEHAQNSVRKILEVLANTKDGAVLYHCSEGKDRTGIVTVVILHLLGVDMETIRQDYLYSNYMLNGYRAKKDQLAQEAGENLCFRANMRILGSVSDAFLDTALIAIEKNYGNLDNYLNEKIGVTPELREALRELYLED